MGSSIASADLSIRAKAALAVRIWHSYVLVRRAIKRKPLPHVVGELGEATLGTGYVPPALLSRAVDRSLRLGPFRPRCLLGALVLYRLLREQGDRAELVIGLPADARTHAAHAWVEVFGRDVGPPPGRGRHIAMTRLS